MFGRVLRRAAHETSRLLSVLALVAALATPVWADPGISIGLILLYSALSAGVSIGFGFLSRALRKPPKQQNTKQEIKITTARLGEPIKRVYGQRVEIGAHVWLRGDITERNDSGARGGKRRKAESNQLRVSTTISVLVCDNLYGHITKVWRICFDDQEVYTYNGFDLQTAKVDNWRGGQSASGGAQAFTIRFGREEEAAVPWMLMNPGGPGEANWVHSKGYLTIHWQDLQLDKYYNRMPNSITVEVETTYNTVAEIILAEAKRAGLKDTDFDLTELNMPVMGLIIGDQTSVRQTIETLQTVHQFAVVEQDNLFVGKRLPQPIDRVIPAAELGAVVGAMEDGLDASTRSTNTALMTREIPQRVEVNYLQHDVRQVATQTITDEAGNETEVTTMVRRYEQSVQGYGLQTVSERGVNSYNFSMVLEPNEANRVAKVNAVLAWAERRTFEFVLPWKHLDLVASDAINIPVESGYNFDVRIERMEFGAYDVINCTAIRQVEHAWDQPGVGSTGLFQKTAAQGDQEGVGGVSPGDILYNYNLKTRLWLWNRTYLIDAHDRKDVIYYCGAPDEPYIITGPPPIEADKINWSWGAYTLMRNQAGIAGEPHPVTGVPYGGKREPRVVGRWTAAATIGRLVRVIDAGVGDADGIITGPVFEIDIYNNQVIASISNEIFASVQTENLFIIGNEVVQAKIVAEVTGATTPPLGGNARRWRLEYCRVGMNGTMNERTAHVVGTGARDGDKVVLYDPRTVFFFEHNQDEYGKEFGFRAVTDGESEATTPNQFFTAQRH